MLPVSLLVLVLAARSASTAAVSASASPSSAVEKCGDGDRLCLAYPDGCNTDKSCTLIATMRPSGSGYQFEMAAQYTGYVAIALAQTTKMGVDGVVECVNTDSTVKLFQSVNKAINPATGKRGNKRLSATDASTITLGSGWARDGVIYCSFSRDAVTAVNGTKYDLDNDSWVLQAAAGNRINNDTSIHHHLEWAVSPKKMNLKTDRGLVEGSSGHRRDDPNKPSGAVPVAANGLTAVAVLLAPLLTLFCAR